MADERISGLTTTTDPTGGRFEIEMPGGLDRGIDSDDVLAWVLANLPSSNAITSPDGSILYMIEVTSAEYAALEAGNDLVPGTAYWLVD
jgi:hypothetical protein